MCRNKFRLQIYIFFQLRRMTHCLLMCEVLIILSIKSKHEGTLTNLLWWYLQYPQYLTLSASDPCSSHNNPANWALRQSVARRTLKGYDKEKTLQHLFIIRCSSIAVYEPNRERPGYSQKTHVGSLKSCERNYPP